MRPPLQGCKIAHCDSQLIDFSLLPETEEQASSAGRKIANDISASTHRTHRYVSIIINIIYTNLQKNITMHD